MPSHSLPPAPRKTRTNYDWLNHQPEQLIRHHRDEDLYDNYDLFEELGYADREHR